jgi:hypothetical protein
VQIFVSKTHRSVEQNEFLMLKAVHTVKDIPVTGSGSL